MVVELKAGDRYTENDGFDRRIRSVAADRVVIEYLRGETITDTEDFTPHDVRRMITDGGWGQLIGAPEAAPDYEKILDFTLAWLNETHPAVLRELHEVIGRGCDERGLPRG